MPFYDYHCERCGPFRVLRPMRESAGSAACPQCAIAADRVFTAPFLAGRGGRDPAPMRDPFGRGRFGHQCQAGCVH